MKKKDFLLKDNLFVKKALKKHTISTFSYSEIYNYFEEQDLNLNSYNFRTKEFKNFENNKIKILYSGCSFTVGDGIPEKYRWSNLLTEKIKEINDVDEYNIAFNGSSIHLIINNLMAFIRNYGKPDYIFMMLPGYAREIHFYKDRYYNAAPPQNKSFNKSWGKHQVDYAKHFNLHNNALNAINMLANFEDYCKEANIKLFYSSWADNFLEIAKNSELNITKLLNKDFFRPLDSKKEITMPENVKNLPYWEVGADGQHPGTCWNEEVANEFFKLFIKSYQNN